MPSFIQAKPRERSSSSIPLPMFLILALFLCLAAFAEATHPKPVPSHFSKLTRAPVASTSSSVCKGTPYVAACESVLVSLKTNSILPSTPKELFDHSVQFTLSQARSALSHASLSLTQTHQEAAQTHLADGMNDCMELLDDTLDQLSNVVNRKNKPSHTHNDVQTWLSAALTNQETCIESLQTTNKVQLEKGIMNSMAQNLSHHISNSLALYLSSYHDPKETNGRKLLSDQRYNEFPSWVSSKDRKLLEASIGEIKAHAVVATDGSGTHKTIGEAIGVRSSLQGGGRTVIYVKAGIYHETIKLPSKQKNVMLVGDGKGKTVIVGSKSAEEGSTTYNSATVGVMGDGFIAKDITIVNNAGPGKGQAVALRVGSDRAVIFRCSIEGYQDTLYTLSKRQFYRETDISGTVDFIFGNSAVVIQTCNIVARQYGERNFLTAQGRSDPNQNTGISIHNCKISGGSVTYLGRPWKQYSRTVIMQSFLDGSIHPAGWYPWAGGSNPKSVYYGEYMNSGPGAATSGRVRWPGYHSALGPTEAQQFTVAGLIAGNQWLPSTGVGFDSGLIG